MDIKGVQPLDGLLDMTVGFRIRQVSISNFPSHGGHNQSQSQPVEQNGVQEEANGFAERRLETNGIGHTRQCQKQSLQCGKCWIISSPVILGLFSVIGGFIDDMRSCGQESFHLIQSALYVHLFEIYQSR